MREDRFPDRCPRITPSDLAIDAAAGRDLAEAWGGGQVPEEAAACLGRFVVDTRFSQDPTTGRSTSRTLDLGPWADGILCGVIGDGPDGAKSTQTALTVVAQGEAPAGPRVGARLRDAVQRVARDEPDDALACVPALADVLLPPWAPGLERLGELRWGLLARTMVALEHAARTGASAGILLTHEIVSLSRTKEARRRNNREDLDLYVRRLSAGLIPRLERGALAGPIVIHGIELFVGKVRRDLT